MKTISVTELRKNISKILDSLDEVGVIMIIRNSKPVAYLVSPKIYEMIRNGH